MSPFYLNLDIHLMNDCAEGLQSIPTPLVTANPLNAGRPHLKLHLTPFDESLKHLTARRIYKQ